MNPFSDFEFLRQAFTEGERWPVNLERCNACSRWNDYAGAVREIFEGGRVGQSLENLQRHGGFKGFNQKSVSVIISATDRARSIFNRRRLDCRFLMLIKRYRSRQNPRFKRIAYWICMFQYTNGWIVEYLLVGIHTLCLTSPRRFSSGGSPHRRLAFCRVCQALRRLPKSTPPRGGRIISIRDDLCVDMIPVALVDLDDRLRTRCLKSRSKIGLSVTCTC